MTRWLYAVVVGLFGAGIIHIVLLLLIPHFANDDAWARLARASELYGMTRLDRIIDGEPIMKVLDPSVRAVACRFDLSGEAVQVSAEGSVPLWSASIYDRHGLNVYSLNDRSTQENKLDFVVLTPDQMAALQTEPPEDFEESTFVEVPLDEGIVVIRAIVPDATLEKTITGFLDQATCSPR